MSRPPKAESGERRRRYELLVVPSLMERVQADKRPGESRNDAVARLLEAGLPTLGDWYCDTCSDYLDGSRVDLDECCDTCGHRARWVDMDDPEAPEA